MKRPLFFGFTLIELLVVMSIIALLAGLTLSTVQYAQNKAARDRAKAEISALELALESYKVDNGDYPRDDSSTDSDSMKASDNPRVVIPKSGSPVPTTSGSSSVVLYKALSGDTDADRIVTATERSANRTYFPFKPGMLSPRNGTGNVTAVIDPFSNVYAYSTIGSGTAATTSGSSPGMNPTFDLWCTVDPAKTGTTGSATWITNW
ncbi:MAG: type II secretion system protein [Chthoniobacteraceae bacterium]